ncbi:MAG: M99 family carboxypeptidase catalytic domain-containing protein [Desulfovibrio sp.]|nr:M99 family carboxypeptidase catalytic domain-containing protein [Desulfovibrio sp.]
MFLCCVLFLLAGAACAQDVFPLDFTVIRLGEGPRTALVVGGIQGDEPGGFSAATLLTTHYRIESGSVWVVPNLNFPSIIKRTRGLHGDMNRKFARLDAKDPEFTTVRRIQELIDHPQVALVLNLHDGSGYYRHKYEDKLRNPARWGQSVIIDQSDLPGVFMGALEAEARNAAAQANESLIHTGHRLHVHNTKTADGDQEMEKSLSFYAVRQGKAAFGLEASKEFSVELRAYYHLLMVESFLRQAGMHFSRSFALTPEGVRGALQDNLAVSFADNRVFLPLEDARPAINYLPLPKSGPAQAVPTKPIMAVLPCATSDNGQFCVYYGNRMLTLIRPEWREVDNSLSAVPVRVDGKDKLVPFGQVVYVGESLQVQSMDGYRVNAIGFDNGMPDEAGVELRLKDFMQRFSVDKQGKMFRVEVYRNQLFSGMFLIYFDNAKKNNPNRPRMARNAGALPDRPGPESSLGF